MCDIGLHIDEHLGLEDYGGKRCNKTGTEAATTEPQTKFKRLQHTKE
jgi:hypothetical protein